jgi:hypothetical protein
MDPNVVDPDDDDEFRRRAHEMSTARVGMPLDESCMEFGGTTMHANGMVSMQNLTDHQDRERREPAAYTKKLEDRLEQLEVKLAVLSRLLQSQLTTKSTLIRPTTPPPPSSLSSSSEEYKNRDYESTSTPRSAKIACDEPPPSAMSPNCKSEMYDKYYSSEDDELPLLPSNTRPNHSHTRNLSFRLLYDGMNTSKADLEYRRASAPPTSSMTAAERQWLEPEVMKYLGKEKSIIIAAQEQDESKQQPAAAESLKALFQEPEKIESTAAEMDLKDMKASNSNIAANGNTLLDDDTVRTNFLNYLNSYQDSTPDVDQQMQEFIIVPGKLESILNFGLLVCVDSYLYMITILPIRFIWSCALLLLRILLRVCKQRPAPSPYRFHRRHSYQIIQVGILAFICHYVLGVISIGKLYHWIRGQSMIKIYVLIAMVEIFDRLFSSLGQDCLESMYWNTVNRPRSTRMITSVVVVLVYATLHTLILFLHVETLNVAINSDDQQLLTLLISGNFAEIKSTVFKKYNKPALFKITASDICERFKLGLFLSLILVLNICQGMEKGQFVGYVRMCIIVWCAELLSDSIKHAFISKFNFLPAKVYPEYALLLAGDVTGIGHEGVNLDHSHAVVKRIGFAQIPLVCVMVRLLQEAMKYARRNPEWQALPSDYSWWTSRLLLFALWLLLFSIKTALGRLLVSISMEKLRAAPEFVDTSKLPKEKKKKS